MAVVPVVRFGMSTITKSSPEESGASAPPRPPGRGDPRRLGDDVDRVAEQSAHHLAVAAGAQHQGVAGEPAERSVLRKPSPIDSTATKTATTSAMPTAVEIDAPAAGESSAPRSR